MKKTTTSYPFRHLLALTALSSLIAGCATHVVAVTPPADNAPAVVVPPTPNEPLTVAIEPTSSTNHTSTAPITETTPAPITENTQTATRKPATTAPGKSPMARQASDKKIAAPGTEKVESKPVESKTAESRVVEPKQVETVVRRTPSPEASGPITDVWERIRRGMQFHDNNQIPGYDKELAWFSNNPNYLNRVSMRARPYLYYIVEQLNARDMPTELALLPIIESAFQPMALSRSNAAGIWQFIPNTGGMYGLKQNSWYDGRRDIYASTRAALDLLRDINKGFKGDWQLTLAAYNAGAGTVSRAIKKNQAQGKPTDFASLDLPAETRSYVPRLIALANIVARAEDFGAFFTPIPNEPYFTVVNVGSTIDLEMAAAIANISRDELNQLNPGFNRRATDPDGPHYLLIPKDKSAAFSSALASISEEDRNPWINYQVKPGENLDNIASSHDTNIDTLTRINTMRTASVKPGDYVLIPRSAKRVTPPATTTLADTSTRSVVALNKPGNYVNTRSEYQVKSGETLWSIAKRMNVEVRDLLTWNDMQPGDSLSIGQKLVMLTRSDNPQTPPLAQKALETLNYIVRSGDTLFAIARQFKVTVSDLVHWNNLGDNASLRPGQVLTLIGGAAVGAGKIN